MTIQQLFYAITITESGSMNRAAEILYITQPTLTKAIKELEKHNDKFDYKVFWGYEDEKLFEFAKADLTELAKSDQPFHMAIQTMDTHNEDGYKCRLCNDDFGKNQYSNVELGYTIIFYENVRSQALGTTARERAESCKNMLLSKSGYKQLKDTQQLSTDYYMAIVSRDLEPVISTDDNLAKFEVWFSRKPQIYMSSGALEWMVTNTANITNPTRFDAQPLITAYGAGTFKVNDQTITISSADEYTVIDSEMMDCYKGSVSKNGLVTFSDHEFPVLVPGVNAVEISSGITKLLVVPRWWRL